MQLGQYMYPHFTHFRGACWPKPFPTFLPHWEHWYVSPIILLLGEATGLMRGRMSRYWRQDVLLRQASGIQPIPIQANVA